MLPTVADIKGLGDKEVQKYIMNERKNSELANRCIIDIGGIPTMFPSTDSSNIPDIRSTITYVSYLCARLLDSSHEILAAIAVQKTFRTYQSKKMEEKQCNKHANIILSQGDNETGREVIFLHANLSSQDNKHRDVKTLHSDKSSTEKIVGKLSIGSIVGPFQNEEDSEVDSEQSSSWKETNKNLPIESKDSTGELSHQQEDSEVDFEQSVCSLKEEMNENMPFESKQSTKEISQNEGDSEVHSEQSSWKEINDNPPIESRDSAEEPIQMQQNSEVDFEQSTCSWKEEANENSTEKLSQKEENSEVDTEQSNWKETKKNLPIEAKDNTWELFQELKDSEDELK